MPKLLGSSMAGLGLVDAEPITKGLAGESGGGKGGACSFHCRLVSGEAEARAEGKESGRESTPTRGRSHRSCPGRPRISSIWYAASLLLGGKRVSSLFIALGFVSG